MCLGSVFRIILCCLSECQFVSFDVIRPSGSSFFVWAYSWWGLEACCAGDGLAASSSFQHGWEALPVFCSQEAQLRLGFSPIIAMEVLFMAPRIVLRPIFWTRSSLLVCIFAAVAHALAPYYNVGLTAHVYTVLIIIELAPQCVPARFFSRTNFLIPFGAIS